MPCLVVRRQLALLVREYQASALDPEHHFVFGVLEIDHLHRVFVPPRGEERCFVDDVGEIGTGQPGRRPRNHAELYVVSERNLARVHLENHFAAADIRHVYDDLPIEATRSQ